MLSFSGGLKVMLAVAPCDMRKGFNGLVGLVSGTLDEDVRSGTLYVFSNRSRTRLKILFWDGSGLWVCSKRLEKGRFAWPEGFKEGQKRVELRPEALAMLTDGIDLKGAKMRPWYERE